MMLLPGAAKGAATPRRLRVGYFEDLTTRVLIHGIDKGLSGAGVRRGTVDEVRAWIEQGDIDVALLPAWDFIQVDRLEMIPGACLSVTGAGNIMLLCSKVLPTEIRSVLVDHEGFGARSLAHIMLPSQTGVYPEFHRAEAPLNPSQFNFAEAPHDAFLLVGDNALRIKRSAFPWVWDLGTAWKNHTQSPMVVHVWCTVKGTFLKGLDNELATLAKSNVKGIGEIAAREGERLGANPEVLAKLLAGVFRYEGGPAQFSALRLYLHELQKARLLAKPRQFTIYEERLSTNAVRLPRF